MAASPNATVTERPDVDVLDPHFHVGDPHPAYRWMRENEPVYRDRNGILLVTRIDHLREVERRAHTFVSSQGYRTIRVPTETSMISKDDPGHTEQRRLVADLFTPKAVSKLEDDVRGIVNEALMNAMMCSQFEVVDTIAARLPAIITCRLIGWPDHLWRDVAMWSERFMRIDTLATDAVQMSDAMRAGIELSLFTAQSVAEHRGCPGHTLMARWANGTIEGREMTADEINSELGLVIPGGAETTRTTLSRALILFSERPDLWEWLAEDPSADPPRRRGAPPVDHPVEQHVPHGGGGDDHRRRARVDRRPDRSRLSVSEPRRPGVRRPRRDRPATRSQPACGVRLRNPLLPRRPRGEAEHARRPRGAHPAVHQPASCR